MSVVWKASDQTRNDTLGLAGGHHQTRHPHVSAGLAVLWTLLVIEAGELIGFIANFDLSALLANGIIAMFVNLIVAQFGNIITAVMWFGYWPGSGGASVVIWVGIAYAGYLLGIHLARESDSLHSVSDLVRRIRAMRNRPKENDPEK